MKDITKILPEGFAEGRSLELVVKGLVKESGWLTLELGGGVTVKGFVKEFGWLVLEVGGGLVVNTELNGITGHELEWF